MKKMYLLTEKQKKIHRPTCIFQSYSREKHDMVRCEKPAVFRYGIKLTDGICQECAEIMSERGVLTVAPDGFEYCSSKKVLKKFGGEGDKSKDVSKGILHNSI